MILPILIYGDPILRKKCEPIEEITDEIRKLAQDMIETMDYKGRAIGLSAPQVGRSIRLFVLRDYIMSPEGQWSMGATKVFINPRLSNPSKETETEDEGCMSVPGIRIPVERPRAIVIEAMDLDGNLFREELEGINARVRMHENDHLNGVLHIDRTDSRTRKKIEPHLRELKKR